jgi:hypothetical protein
MNVKHYVGAGFKVIIALIVILFLGLKSLDFFYFVTPADQWYYAYLGFGLTGGGVIAYLIIFLWDADSALKKSIAISMLIFCVLGELASAGFGLQINAWKAGGYGLKESDFNSMILVIQLLGFVHAMALIGYVAGDPIRLAFGDEDGDGIPNMIDPDYKPAPKQNKSSSLRFPWSRKPVVNQSVVGQPRFDISNLSQEQMMEIIKHAQELQAYNDAQAAKNGNGKVVTDPQNRQS